jgi:hypothetical protein|tara:strand:+ start:475 stop:642 length:168 start_codon:yes stop_codon:yes gene_type:complete
MNPTPRQTDEESAKAIEEFLAKGGKIEVCEPFARTEDLEIKGGFYGRKPKKKPEE